MIEHPIVLCSPVSARASRVRHSVIRNCAKCGQPVHVAPSMVARLEDGARPYCLSCGMKDVKDCSVLEVEIPDDQLEEIRRVVGPVSREELLRLAREFLIRSGT